MKAVIESFFSHYGAEIRADGAVLHVRLPPEPPEARELAEFLGGDQFRLVFDLDDLTEDADLVSTGSFLVNRIREFMADRGRKTYLALPERIQVSKAEIRQKLEAVDCEVKAVRAEKAERFEVAFVFKISYLCDEKREELFGVAADAETRRLRPVELAELPVTEPARSRQRDSFPEEKMVELFNLAAMEASQHARRAGQELERDIVDRLRRSVERLESYYQQLLGDLQNPDSPESLEKAAEYEEERKRKLQETMDNHALVIRVQLVQYRIIERPLRRFEFLLSRAGQKDGASIETAIYYDVDLYDGTHRASRCHACEAELSRATLCVSGHVVCPNCLERCASCDTALCSRCAPGKCHLCSKRLCSECLVVCASCGEGTCPAETTPCDFCREPVCKVCHAECVDCRKLLCAAHAASCARTGKPVCPECVQRCTGCQAAVARSQTAKCSVCGQVFCGECLVRSAKDGKTYCAGHRPVEEEKQGLHPKETDSVT